LATNPKRSARLAVTNAGKRNGKKVISRPSTNLEAWKKEEPKKGRKKTHLRPVIVKRKPGLATFTFDEGGQRNQNSGINMIGENPKDAITSFEKNENFLGRQDMKGMVCAS